ncbi:hypothetical protein ACS0TY_023725 [Phlomoides rotata]
MMLTLLISGPKQPGNDIDVHPLQSLFTNMIYSVEEINEMRVEWAECIQKNLYA